MADGSRSFCAGVDRLLMCVCYLGTMHDIWLIPVRDGLPAVEQALEHVDDSVPPTTEELRSLADVAMRYVSGERNAVAVRRRR